MKMRMRMKMKKKKKKVKDANIKNNKRTKRDKKS